MLDVISEIEDGLVKYVGIHPGEFGYTTNQFAKSGGLFWGAVKKEWKRLLIMASQKCETLVLTTHMRSEFHGARPTGKRIPSGKDTILDITSLYMTLVRNIKTGAKEVPLAPSGICKHPGGKSRLVRVNPITGVPEQLLPPHIPNASPAGIRFYLEHPPDFANLKPEEQAVPTQELTDDDRLGIRAGIAASENEKAQADLERAIVEANKVKPEGGHKMSSELLKGKLLDAVGLDDAKTILYARYKAKKVADLNFDQQLDLDKHIDALKK